MNIIQQFKQISVKDGHLKASYEEHNPVLDDTHLITYENQAGIHPDLSGSLQRLAVHVRLIAGLPETQPVYAYIIEGKTFGNDTAVAIEEDDLWMFAKPIAEC